MLRREELMLPSLIGEMRGKNMLLKLSKVVITLGTKIPLVSSHKMPDRDSHLVVVGRWQVCRPLLEGQRQFFGLECRNENLGKGSLAIRS